MRTFILAATVLALAGTASAKGGSHSTRGYVKSSGSYVAPSHARNPNSTRVDNYSTKGNVNPYTGAAGTRPVK